MTFVAADDLEAAALRDDLTVRAADVDATGLMTANVWLWAVVAPDPEPRAVLSALIAHPGLPCRELVEPHAASCPWEGLAPDAARAAAVKLLTGGAALEIAAFQDELQLAVEFADRLLAWVGRPVAGFANMVRRPDGSAAGFGVFRVPHWVDEGLVLVGPGRVAMLWFVGTD